MSKLGRYQLERLTILKEMEELRKQKRSIENKITKRSRRLKQVGNAIYDLKHEGDVPHITDHAIVRYLERVEKVNILDLKLKVSQHRDAIMQGNVVVTVGDSTFYEDEVEDDQSDK